MLGNVGVFLGTVLGLVAPFLVWVAFIVPVRIVWVLFGSRGVHPWLSWGGSILIATLLMSVARLSVERRFATLCERADTAVVWKRVEATGLIVEPFLMGTIQGMLGSDGFDHVEAVAAGGTIWRFRRSDDGRVRGTVQDRIRAQHKQSDRQTEAWWGASTTVRTITRVDTGEELARASMSILDSGIAGALPRWRPAPTCPDPTTPRGRRQADAFSRLAALTLGREPGLP